MKKTKIKKDLFNRIKEIGSENKVRGITLISLVITIIILLILAGITISQLSGSGIFEKAKEARGRYKNAQNEEEMQIARYGNEIDSWTRTGDANQSLVTILYDGSTEDAGGITVASNTDTNAQRTFSDDVNKYDILHIYINSTDSSIIFTPNIIDKTSFNQEIYYYIPGFSSTVGYASGYLKIDTTNNKIIFLKKGYSNHIIKKVVGIKL